jgi:hypothetical protein
MSASPSRRRRDGVIGSKIPSKTVLPVVQSDAKSKEKAKGKRKRRDEVVKEGTVGELLLEYARKTRATSARVKALPEDAPLPERTVQVSTWPPDERTPLAGKRKDWLASCLASCLAGCLAGWCLAGLAAWLEKEREGERVGERFRVWVWVYVCSRGANP